MWLQPPKAGVKPKSNRTQNGALSGKAPARIKAFKDPALSGPAPAEDQPFVAWAKSLPRDTFPFYKQEACDYLCAGPPFRGDSLKNVKETLKDNGARWARNELKTEECTDKTIRHGWWAAMDVRALQRLLSLPRADDGQSSRKWSCLDLSPSQNDEVVQWIRQFNEDLKQPDAEAQQPDDSQYATDGDADDPMAKRRSAREDAVPDWILRCANGEHLRRRLRDPVCIDCGGSVTDQFLDCGCGHAHWARCAQCSGKYRTDEAGAAWQRSCIRVADDGLCICQEGPEAGAR